MTARDVDEDNVRAFLRGRIASYKIPADVVFFGDEDVVLTGNAKIRGGRAPIAGRIAHEEQDPDLEQGSDRQCTSTSLGPESFRSAVICFRSGVEHLTGGTMEQPDVVVIGAGIAGGAMAAVLARAVKSVLVLERTLEHEDRVRGEYMHPWGVAEAQRLGLYDDLLRAGGKVLERLRAYDECRSPEESEAGAIGLALLPGVDGPLGVSHPGMCNAFDEAAVSSGAELIRGVRDVTVTAGPRPPSPMPSTTR